MDANRRSVGRDDLPGAGDEFASRIRHGLACAGISTQACFAIHTGALWPLIGSVRRALIPGQLSSFEKPVSTKRKSCARGGSSANDDACGQSCSRSSRGQLQYADGCATRTANTCPGTSNRRCSHLLSQFPGITHSGFAHVFRQITRDCSSLATLPGAHSYLRS